MSFFVKKGDPEIYYKAEQGSPLFDDPEYLELSDSEVAAAAEVWDQKAKDNGFYDIIDSPFKDEDLSEFSGGGVFDVNGKKVG